MTSPLSISSIPVVILSALLVFPVHADEGWYIGISAGESRYDGIKPSSLSDPVGIVGIDGPPLPIDPILNIPDFDGPAFIPVNFTVDTDDEDTGWKLSAGYRFNKHLAVEASYVDAGEAEITMSTQPALATTEGDFLVMAPVDPVFSLSTTESTKIKARGFDISALGSYPLSENFSVLARLGLVYSEVETSSKISTDISGGGPIFSGQPLSLSFKSEESEFNPVAGLGIQYRISSIFSVRLEWTRYLDAIDLGQSEEDLDNYTLGIFYHFK